ncbi:transketolase, partial [Patescibacteria group bacterium]
MDYMNYAQITGEIRKRALEMFLASQSTHIGSSLSIIDILTVLYYKILSIDPNNPDDSERDRFILSKGHAIAALYATLAQRGFFPREDLKKYCKEGEKLFAHSTKSSVPGVEVSTGSLGHGLPIGIGMALVAKNDNKKHKVFV